VTGPRTMSTVEGRRGRLYAPAAARNRDPILDVLRRVLPDAGTVVEIASGSGEHAVHFAAALPGLTWVPSDTDPEALASISAWRASDGVGNLLAPVRIDAAEDAWPLPPGIGHVVAVVSINCIHIAPWTVCEGIVGGARRLLEPGGILYFYGPFRRNGRHTAPSNEEFDAMLRRHDPEWGVRDLDAVVELAGQSGFDLAETVAMPANNLSVIFRRRG
jgi:SAM-dependent methyltransferase